MYENKKRNKSIYGYLTDIVITILTLLMLNLLITTLAYKGTISVKYLKYAMMAVILAGSYISSAVMKTIYGEDAVKYTIATAAIIVTIIMLYGFSEQGGGGDVKTAIINSFFAVVGKIIPNVIKPAREKKKRRKR